mmetsp:Transcript_9996/g.10091  ORF Transcript_9996/g.10091 Transcript_9996/m.10091 type:complete len:148 (-) Transcript_9996:95-538(-)
MTDWKNSPIKPNDLRKAIVLPINEDGPKIYFTDESRYKSLLQTASNIMFEEETDTPINNENQPPTHIIDTINYSALSDNIESANDTLYKFEEFLTSVEKEFPETETVTSGYSSQSQSENESEIQSQVSLEQEVTLSHQQFVRERIID